LGEGNTIISSSSSRVAPPWTRNPFFQGNPDLRQSFTPQNVPFLKKMAPDPPYSPFLVPVKIYYPSLFPRLPDLDPLENPSSRDLTQFRHFYKAYEMNGMNNDSNAYIMMVMIRVKGKRLENIFGNSKIMYYKIVGFFINKYSMPQKCRSFFFAITIYICFI
jgi:hypothetical protein